MRVGARSPPGRRVRAPGRAVRTPGPVVWTSRSVKGRAGSWHSEPTRHTFPAALIGVGGRDEYMKRTPRVPEGSGMDDQVEDVDASTRLPPGCSTRSAAGDLNALLLEFRPTTIVRTEDRTWSVQGEEEVLYWLEEAFERFPGLGLRLPRAPHRLRPGDRGGPRPRHRPAAARRRAGRRRRATAPAPLGRAGAAGPWALVLDRDFGKSEHATAEHAGPADRAARRRVRARDRRQLPPRPAAVRDGPARRPARHGRLGDPVGVRGTRRLGVQDLPDGQQAATSRPSTHAPLPVPLARVATSPSPSPSRSPSR